MGVGTIYRVMRKTKENVGRQGASAGRRKGERVHHPSHYGSGVYECINVIEAWGLGFSLGNVVKYIARAGKKGGVGKKLEDLQKAAWYLQREIENEGRE
jgi:hypothetical protein